MLILVRKPKYVSNVVLSVPFATNKIKNIAIPIYLSFYSNRVLDVSIDN
jgi:hypothetical protein